MNLKQFEKFCKKNDLHIPNIESHWDEYKDMQEFAIITVVVDERLKEKWLPWLNEKWLKRLNRKQILKKKIISFIKGFFICGGITFGVLSFIFGITAILLKMKYNG